MKYKSLCIGIKRIWNMKCFIVPVTFRATGMVTKVLNGNLEAIRGKHSLEALQKTVVCETSHIIQKVLQSES
jgi:hypothetical protein